VKCTTNGKIQTHVLADFRETLTRSTTPSEQQSRQTLTEFDDVYTSAVSLAWFDSATGRIPPTVLYCWWSLWCLLSRSGRNPCWVSAETPYGPLHH